MMPNRGRIATLVVLAVTLGRLSLCGVLVAAVAAGEGFTVALLIGLVVAADIADGVIARALGRETSTRRIMDVSVDKVTIHATFLAICIVSPTLWIYCAPLLLRDAMAALGYGLVIRRQRLVLTGGAWHRIGSLACAGLGIALVSAHGDVLVASALTASAIGFLLLADFAGGYIAVLHCRRQPTLSLVRVDSLSGLVFLTRAARSAGGRLVGRLDLTPQLAQRRP